MRAARTQRGIALVTAVMIVAIAAAIAAQIAFAHQIWTRQMENIFDRGATDWLRRGALHWASTALVEDAAQGNTVDHLGERWAMGLPTLPVEGGTIRVSIEDGQSRFNLNNLVRNNVASPADLEVLRRLLEALRLDPSLRYALLDWIDPANFNPGYLMRSMHLLPRRGDKPEWQHTQDYWREKEEIPAIDLDAKEFVYS